MNESSDLQGQHFASCVASQAPLVKGSRPSGFLVGMVEVLLDIYDSRCLVESPIQAIRHLPSFLGSRFLVGSPKMLGRDKVRTRAGRKRDKASIQTSTKGSGRCREWRDGEDTGALLWPPFSYFSCCGGKIPNQHNLMK